MSYSSRFSTRRTSPRPSEASEDPLQEEQDDIVEDSDVPKFHRITRLALFDRPQSKYEAPSTGSSTLVDHPTPFASKFAGLSLNALPESEAKGGQFLRESSSQKISRAFDRILRESVTEDVKGKVKPPRAKEYFADGEEDAQGHGSKLENASALSLNSGRRSFRGFSTPLHRKYDSSTPKSRIQALESPYVNVPGHYHSTTPAVPRKILSEQLHPASFENSPKTPYWPGGYRSAIPSQQVNQTPVASTSKTPIKILDKSHPSRKATPHASLKELQIEEEEEEEDDASQIQDELSASLSKIRLESTTNNEISNAVERRGSATSLPESISPFEDLGSDTHTNSDVDDQDTVNQAGHGDDVNLKADSLKAKLLAKRKAVALEAALMEQERLASRKEVKERQTQLETLSKSLLRAEQLDKSLKLRANEVRNTIESVAESVSDKISQAVDTTLRLDNSRRHRWLWYALATEISLLCFLYSYMNRRLENDFQTNYYDPFNSFLYSPRLAPYLDILLPPETLSLFSPTSSPYSQNDDLSNWLWKYVLGFIANQWVKLCRYLMFGEDVPANLLTIPT